jgi:hypothetical protein
LSRPFASTPVFETEATVRIHCQTAAAQLTRGYATDARVDAGSLKVVFVGQTDQTELRLFATAMWRHLDPTLTKIVVVDAHDNELLSVARPSAGDPST